MASCLRTVLWRNEQDHLYEYCSLQDTGQGTALEGVVVAAVDAQPLYITYMVACDLQGLTRFVRVDAVGGRGERHIRLEVDEQRNWHWHGRELPGRELPDSSLPECRGLSDVDLGFSPATNTLPIRRLNLHPGQSQAVTVTWVRFPQFDVIPFPQRYTCLAPNRYRFESLLDDFQAELVVDELGIVRQYGEFWESVAAGDC